MAVPSFTESQLRQIATILEGAATHRELSELFSESGLDEQGGAPKWERILLALSRRQGRDRCGNNVAHFIQVVLNPVRFVDRPDDFEDYRRRLNEVLAFCGLHLGENGKLRQVTAATTLSEAQKRADSLRAELLRRGVHGDVLRFCKAELLEENYFHAILEATKSVADKVRSLTGLVSDGAPLADAAFGGKKPRLALNRLITDSELSEQSGFSNLVKGVFGVFRNQTAHEPRITKSYSEQDALDLLTLVSYIHRRIDSSVVVPWTP